MPQLDLDSLVSGKIACETMATSDPNHHHHSDFPVESFYLPKEDELEWFSRNAFYERKESTKGNGNNNNNSNSTLTSNQNSQRFSKSSIIGLPKKQDSHFSVSKRRKPVSVKFFPKRTRSNNRVSEPSSPKVSCIGRVRSKKDKSRTPSKKNEAVSTSHRRESERRTGFWSWAFNCCKSEGVDADEKKVSSRKTAGKKSKVTTKTTTTTRENPVEPPGLGGMNRFVSGRRSDSWAGDLDSVNVFG